MHKLFLVLCLFAAVSVAQYNLYYSAYLDNVCTSVDAAHTGQIFPYKCAIEYRKTPQTGKITFVSQDYLTSCDYSDDACAVQTVCQNYTNGNCYASTSAPFSNKYSIALNAAGTFDLTYTSYKDSTCTAVDIQGPLTEGACNQEFRTPTPPQSGKITYIDDNYLISCDYSDQNCNNEIICERYNNSDCYGFKTVSFSNKYSWAVGSANTQAPNTGSTPTQTGSGSTTPTQTGSSNTQAPNTGATSPTQTGSSTPSPIGVDTGSSSPVANEPNYNGAFQIKYAAFTDNHCGATNNAMTGQIFAYTCAPEFRRHASGKITQIVGDVLTSCDYSDTQCQTQTVCETYTNGQCYASSTVQFSNKYTFSSDGNGGFNIQYFSFNDQTCTTPNAAQTGKLLYQTCAPEFERQPQSGEITFINDEYLTSCDYVDSNCQVLDICVNYTNGQCSDRATVGFSDIYTWSRTQKSSNPTSSESSSEANNNSVVTTPTSKYVIQYTAYTDNTCSNVDNAMTGQIFADKCVPEKPKVKQSGKIVFINNDYLVSCDYSDTECGVQTVCGNYTNSVCYASSTTAFSNKYSWTTNADGTFAITYTSFSDKICSTYQETGQIYQGVCAAEYREKPQSGMITFINDYYLTSCDYSDLACQTVTICVNYSNNVCDASKVVQFSDKYSWTRSTGSAASVAASVALVLVALVAALF